MFEVHVFRRDRWDPLTYSEASQQLEAGDLINLDGHLAWVTGKPKEGSALNIPVKTYEPEPSSLAVGGEWQDRDYLVMAMDMVGAGLECFDDGTGMITNPEKCLIYSPRLLIGELNEFCQTHIDRYQAFFEQHASQLEEGDSIPMTQWW